MSVLTNDLDFLSDVLQDFCTKYDLPEASADDILYSSTLDGDVELSQYQKDWLVRYINIWDLAAANE
tara:strand:- start:328 stop:528 length:201 start_codon:yes stop_codon:yes gene_type:complete